MILPLCRHEKPLLRAIFVLARGCNARCSICGMKNSRSNNNRNSPRMMDGEEQHDMVIGQRVDFMRLLTCLTLLTSIDTDKGSSWTIADYRMMHRR